MSSFIIYRENQEYGPYTLETIKTFLETGNALESDYVRNEDSTEWTTIGALLASTPPPPPPPPVASNPPPTPAARAQSMRRGLRRRAKNETSCAAGCLRQICAWTVLIIIIVIVSKFIPASCTAETPFSKQDSYLQTLSAQSAVEVYLKESYLRDPDSYEGVSWGPLTKTDGDGYKILHTFRAKNGFGGYNDQTLVFYLDANGEVTSAAGQ